MALYEIVSEDSLQAPVLIGAMGGWVDASGVATACASRVVGDGHVVATFDGDALFDYRAQRPTLEIADGTMRDVTWPQLLVHATRVGGRDLLVLHGPEPDYRWRELSGAVLDLGLRLGVVEWVSLGAIGAAVPHTRPTRLLSTASRPDLVRAYDRLPAGILRVPAAVVTLVEHAYAKHGVPAMGFWAQVPHYVGVTYAPAVMALLQRLSQHLGVSFAVEDLEAESREQRSQLDAIVAQRPEAKAYLAQLEEMSAGAEERIPTGEEIASEIERFLHGQNPFADD